MRTNPVWYTLLASVLVTGLLEQAKASDRGVPTIDQRVTALEAKVAALEAKVASLTTALVTANANITSLGSGITTANAQIASLQADLAVANTKITSLEAGLATANSKVAALQSEQETQNTDIAVLKAQVADHTALLAGGGGGDVRFTYNGDGTISDRATTLMWQVMTAPGLEPEEYTFSDGMAYCENLVLGGHDDWRLPTIDELKTLIDPNVNDPATPEIFRPFTASSWYWSSTLSDYCPNNSAWIISFSDVGSLAQGCFTNYYGDYVKNFIRAVRSGL